jgi:hypothetical protein
MKGPEIVAAISPVIDAFERLSVRYSIVGSVASSAHGIARATLDADLVADLDAEHVDPLVDALIDDYSAEDTVLHKLEWYRAGAEVSERQWGDIVGVLKVQSDALDIDYMRQWAADLGVGDLLERAIQEAGTRVE